MGMLISTHDVAGMRVFGGKDGSKKIGKVRHCVFHPKERRCIGFIVKRPDAALMFHRKDLFLALDGFNYEDGRAIIREDMASTDKAACRRLGVQWDECVIWEGMPILTESGDNLGIVGQVSFDSISGKVASLQVDAGATANALLGTRDLPASIIRGFRRGVGEAIKAAGDYDEDDEQLLGAMLVTDDALNVEAQGGVAEKAGAATAAAAGQAKKVVKRVVKPKAQEAAQVAGAAVNKGAFATGRQLGKAAGMFSAFKEEYNKARHED